MVFSVFSAFLFLNFFEPFGLYYDRSITQEDVFIELFIAMAIAFIVLLLTQFVARVLFKIEKFNPVTLFFWFLLEAVLVATAWLVLEISDKDFTGDLLIVWRENILAYILIFFFPYFLYVSYVHIKNVVKKLEDDKNRSLSESKLIQDIALKDENSVVKLVLKTDNLLFIRSADNYVEINYLENDILSKSLLRNSIKKLEPDFFNTRIIRCHRSFIVNTDKIEIAKKTPTGFNLKLTRFSDSIIPVSKSYISEFKKFLP